MSIHNDLGRIDRAAQTRNGIQGARVLLPFGLLVAAIGYYGPWIAHSTAALTLSGVDMGEFVKFLPGALDGSLPIVRQIFYLPPLAVVASIALLVGSRRLCYAWPLRVGMLLLAVPVSLQLLPPAWSPASLGTAEFRLQILALGICWLLLAGFWLLGQVPARVTGALAAALSLLAGTLSAWQFLVAKPAIDAVYQDSLAAGWGLFLCLLGLAIMAIAEASLVFRVPVRGEEPWPNL